MNKNKFSVIIPLYNKEHYIISTLESVLNQTYNFFEIIIINDGSTDKSLEMLQPFTREERLRIINKRNSGVSASRNLGIEIAQYEWIAFLDGDDLWDKDYLLEANRMIVTYPEATIIGMNYDCTIPFVNKAYKTEGYIENYFKINLQEYLFNSSSVIIKKGSFVNEKFRTDLSIGEDIEMWHRLAKNNIIAYCPTIFSFYRKNISNEISRQRKSRMNTNWSFHLDFSSTSSKDEKKYLYKILGATCIISIRSGSCYDIILLIRKHGLSRVFFSAMQVIKQKLNRRN